MAREPAAVAARLTDMGSEQRATGRTRRRRPATIIASAVASGALVVAGCASSDSDESASTEAATEESFAPEATYAAADTIAAGDVADDQAGGATEATVPDAALSTGLGLDALGRDLAITMSVEMTTDDVRATVDGIRRAAVANGGAVVSADVDYGTTDPDTGMSTGQAQLVVKVPPAGLDGVLGGLDRLGEVVAVGQDADDLTDRLVDLDVRIDNQRELVERVRGLLDAATDLDQVIRLEGELTERQVELESMLATQQQLTDRVSLSTVTITVRPTPATPAPPEQASDDGIADAFADGWDAFVATLFGIGFVLAILAPFLVVGAVALAIAWAVHRARRARRSAPAPAPTAAAAVTDEEPVSASPRG